MLASPMRLLAAAAAAAAADTAPRPALFADINIANGADYRLLVGGEEYLSWGRTLRKPQHHTVTIPAAGHVQLVVRPHTPPVAATGRRDTPIASSLAAPSSLPRAGAWIASDGKDWEVCQRMQPLHQPCNLPNQTMFSTHFFCDVQLMEAEWNRSKTPGILDIYSCRPEKIWMNTNMKLAPGPPTGQHNPHNLSGLSDGWEPRLRGWLADAEPLLLAGKIQGVYLGDELLCLGVPFSNYTAVADIISAWLSQHDMASRVFVYSNECGNPFTLPGYIWSVPEDTGLPRSLTQISIDEYRVGAAEPLLVEQFYTQHMLPKMHDHQSLVVVPGMFAGTNKHDTNSSAAGSLAQQQVGLLDKLDAYFKWYQREPRMLGINFWHWASMPAAQVPAGSPDKVTQYVTGMEALKALWPMTSEIRAAAVGPAPPPGPPIVWKSENGTLRPYCHPPARTSRDQTPTTLKLDDTLQAPRARLPVMGYSNWYDTKCDVHAERFLEAADALQRTGLKALGYTQINVDAGWALPQRDSKTHELVADPRFFPQGMDGLGAELGRRGFQLGGYTDRGGQQCGPSPGSKGYEALDAALFVRWNLSYVKSDDCNTTLEYAPAMADYRVFANALQAAAASEGKAEPYFLICGCKLGVGAPDPRKGWEQCPRDARTFATAWRIASDDYQWGNVLTNANINAGLAQFAGAGHFNGTSVNFYTVLMLRCCLC